MYEIFNRIGGIMVSVLASSAVDRGFEPRLGVLFWICQKWVSEWLLFNANSAIFRLYHGENKLIFNEMMMVAALY
jgi:hypothetical protein